MDRLKRASAMGRPRVFVAAVGLGVALLGFFGLAMVQDIALAASDSTPAAAWSPEADCAGCHEAEAASFAAEGARDHGGTAVDKAKPADAVTAATSGAGSAATMQEGEEELPLAAHHAALDCTTCHSDVEGLEEAHEKATGPKKVRRLKWTTVGSGTCLACHTSWDDLAGLTEDVDVLTDKMGTTVNPHAAPQTHTGGEKPYLSCTDCHDMHNGEPTEEASAKACASCHHADVYECNTCH